MKWFQHHSDAYTDLKLQDVVDEFGLEGYGFYWILCELVAQQGNSYQIKAVQNWTKAVQRWTRLDKDKTNKLLKRFAELGLIDKKGLNRGILSIPKMADYSDDYTKRVRRVSEQPTDNVRQEEKRRDKIRLDKKRRDKISSSSSSFKENLKKGLKPYYDGMSMRLSNSKLWVIPLDGGRWKEFAGLEKEIVWK